MFFFKGATTFCIIANEKTVRVSNIIKLNKYNVVKPSWLLECIENNVLREWCPNDFLAMAPSTAEEVNKEFDSYGDSYTKPLDESHLKKLMNSMKVDVGDFYIKDHFNFSFISYCSYLTKHISGKCYS